MIRGIVNSVLEGFIKLFSASGRADETISDREYFQHYGFTSRPLNGAEIIIIKEGNHYLAIASDDRRYRLALENGEVAIYSDEGDKIHLKRGRKIEIVGGEEVDVTTKKAKITASTSCEITSPAVTINAQTTVGVNSPVVTITASGSCVINSPSVVLGEGATRRIVDERFLAAYNNHTHPGGWAPSLLMTPADHCTNVTKAL